MTYTEVIPNQAPQCGLTGDTGAVIKTELPMCDCHCTDRTLGRNLFEQELDRLHQAAAHNDIAFAAAFHFCVSEGKCPPKWLIKEIDDLLIELLKRERTTKRGRSAGRVARCRQDLWDFERSCAVDEVRRIRGENAHELEITKDYPPELEKRFSHLKKVRKWLGYGTYECAAMFLRGTFAACSSHGVRASYRKVRRAYASRTAAWRYYTFPGDFLGRVGIPYPLTPLPGTKTANFFDLQP
jgi:hypothetical protein